MVYADRRLTSYSTTKPLKKTVLSKETKKIYEWSASHHVSVKCNDATGEIIIRAYERTEVITNEG